MLDSFLSNDTKSTLKLGLGKSKTQEKELGQNFFIS